MDGKVTPKDWFPLAKAVRGFAQPPTGEAFRTEWIDFEHGIRVGRLEPHERITQILKFHLENRYATRFITDRWGRGVYWQWICWLPRANREAKPESNGVNFGCAKLFIMADRDREVFKSGLQVERGRLPGRGAREGWVLRDDWDWHRLMRQCRRGSKLDIELQRLIKEDGFVAEVGDWEANAVFSAKNFKSAAQIRAAARKCSRHEWVGFQLYYPMPRREVKRCTGHELVKAVHGVFEEVVPAMNACMQVTLPVPG